MSTKITMEFDARHEAIMRRALALAEEMEQLALAAPEGAVFDACEEAVIQQGRTFQAKVLGGAVARRIEAAEKKGRQSASVPAVGKKKTADPNHADS